MPDLLLQFLGLSYLLGGLAFGYGRWIRPRQATLNRAQFGLLFLVLLALMGGFIGSPFWWFDLRQSFAWDLPPLASCMLAAAGWSFFVACLFALNTPTFRRLRLVVLLLFVYLTPLAVVILLFHLDRFDPAAPITYGFFVIVCAMIGLTLWYLVRPVSVLAEEPADDTPTPPLLKFWLAAIAIITGVWGLALFITDTGPLNFIWVWPGDLLSSRLIGVMLLTIATGAAYSWRYTDLSSMMLTTIITYGVGLTIASLWNVLAGKPIPLSYALVFGMLSLVSAGFLIAKRTVGLAKIRP